MTTMIRHDFKDELLFVLIVISNHNAHRHIHRINEISLRRKYRMK